MADNTLDGTSTVGGGSQGRNVIIFVADGLRPSSVNTFDGRTVGLTTFPELVTSVI